jgi:hypothetical protein
MPTTKPRIQLPEASPGYDALLDSHEDACTLNCGCRLFGPFLESGQPDAVALKSCRTHQLRDVALKPFATGELVSILEAARVALADGDTFDRLAADMDLSDAALKDLQTRLEHFLQS